MVDGSLLEQGISAGLRSEAIGIMITKRLRSFFRTHSVNRAGNLRMQLGCTLVPAGLVQMLKISVDRVCKSFELSRAHGIASLLQYRGIEGLIYGMRIR
ncbi:MAG: hypothetical protein EOO77_06615 [Oxalobacteraceae bacterium]|nr:MAG: hypothetical protein EOO77_06615 [Oxalobacteraceae bacterium]